MSSFLEHLASRATRANAEHIVEPALAPDMVPNPYYKHNSQFAPYAADTVPPAPEVKSETPPAPSSPTTPNANASGMGAHSSSKPRTQRIQTRSAEFALVPNRTEAKASLPEKTSEVAKPVTPAQASLSQSRKPAAENALQAPTALNPDLKVAKNQGVAQEIANSSASAASSTPIGTNALLPARREHEASHSLKKSSEKSTPIPAKTPKEAETKPDEQPKTPSAQVFPAQTNRVQLGFSQEQAASEVEVQLPERNSPRSQNGGQFRDKSKPRQETPLEAKPRVELSGARLIAQPPKSLVPDVGSGLPRRTPSSKETVVTIHIGRIEVHAAKSQERIVASSRRPALSLNEYLKQRSEEHR
jgi:hypothetical protein